MTDQEQGRFEHLNMEMLNWAETHGLDNLREHLHDLDSLKKDATQMLSIIVVGLGATIGYVAHQLDQGGETYTGWAVVALSVYLIVVASFLIVGALMIKEKPLASDEPLGLVDSRFSLEAMKLAEIRAIQDRIVTASTRNARTAKRINIARWMAIAAPLVFGSALVIAQTLCKPESGQGSPARLVRVGGAVVGRGQEPFPLGSAKEEACLHPDQGSGPESQGLDQEPAQGTERVPEPAPMRKPVKR